MVKVRHRGPAKGADRPGPKGHGIVDWNPRRRWRQDPPDYRTQPPHPSLHIGQQGKPHSPRHIAMRLQHAEKTASNLPIDTPEREHARAVIVGEVDRLHWRIWN